MTGEGDAVDAAGIRAEARALLEMAGVTTTTLCSCRGVTWRRICDTGFHSSL